MLEDLQDKIHSIVHEGDDDQGYTRAWGFKYFPSQDGPVHVENANVIQEYYHQDRTIFRTYYAINKNFDPTWFGHLVMAGLMFIVPILVAEKIFLTGYVILLPVSIRYALKAINPGAVSLSVLGFPFIYNYLFQKGFYDFSYSLVLFFFVFGYWIKNQEEFTHRKMVTLMGLALLLYSVHIVSLVMTGMAIGLLLIYRIVLELVSQIQQGRFRPSLLWNIFRSRILRTLFAFIPSLILVVFFLLPRWTGMTIELPQAEFLPRLYSLFHLDSLVSYSETEAWISTTLFLLFMTVILYLLIIKFFRRQVNRWDGLLFIAGCFLYIYFIVPDRVSVGGHMKERVSLYPFFIFIMWFGAQPLEWLKRLRFQLFVVVIIVALLGLYITKYSELNDYLEEYMSGMHLIEPNSTLLPLCFSHNGQSTDGRVLSSRINVFLHASGYIAAQRDIVEFDNYQAKKDYFPIRYRHKLNPFIHIAREHNSIESVPPFVDFLSYHQRTGGQVDYILVWSVSQEQREHRDTKSIFSQLQQGYDLIYNSPQRGLMQLYRRKNWGE